MMFHGISLRRIFVSVSVIFAALGIAVSGYLWWLDHRLNVASASMSNAIANIRFAQQLQIDLLAHKRNLLVAELTDDEERWEHVDELTSALHEATRQLRRIDAVTPHPRLRNLEVAIEKYLSTQSKLFRQKESALGTFNKATPSFDEAFSAADVVAKFNTRSAEEDQAEIVRGGDLAKWLGSALVVLVFGIVTAILFSLNRLLFKPLSELNRAIGRVSKTGQVDALATEEGAEDVKELAQSFNQMTLRLKDQEELRARMIAAIAHDIRSPIGAMRMSVEVLLDETENTPEERNTFLRILHGQIENLLTLSNDLTETAAIHGGNLRLSKVVTDVGDLVAHSVSLYRASSKRHRLVYDPGNGPYLAAVDPNRLSQVLNNIIGNALKYSPSGGTVRVTLQSLSNSVIIAVSDEGLGIPTGELESIFEPFKRSSSTREKVTGLGLGLATSRKLVRAMDGDIKVESRPGAGSTFSIILPESNLPESIENRVSPL